MEMPCSVQINAWQCQNGFLTQNMDESTTNYPCPKCNTEAFLLNAKKVAESKRLTSPGCPCCDQRGSPADYWLSALRSAQQYNTQTLGTILSRLGTVTTIDHNRAPIKFQYGPGASSEQAPTVVSPRFRCDPI